MEPAPLPRARALLRSVRRSAVFAARALPLLVCVLGAAACGREDSDEAERAEAARRFERGHADLSRGKPPLTAEDLQRYLRVLEAWPSAGDDVAKESALIASHGYSMDDWLATRMRISWVRFRLLLPGEVPEAMRADAEALRPFLPRLEAADPAPEEFRRR